MAIKALKKVTGIPGLHVKSDSAFRDAVIFMDLVDTAPTAASSLYGLYVDTAGQLIFTSNGSDTIIGAAGGGGNATWESIYTGDQTLGITTGTFTITQSSDAAILTLNKSGVGAGALIDLTNSGTGADIIGTSDTWQVSKAGAATFTDIILGDSEAITLGDGSDATIEWDGSLLNIAGATDFDDAVTMQGALTVGADVIFSDGSLSITDADNAETVTVINNTATTIGNASSAAVVQVESTSLTTGCLLGLQLTEGTLNGGSYLRAWDATGAGAVFTVAENGVTTIAGAAGANALVVTAGDVVFSDASVAITDADNAASFSLTNNTATTASVVVLAGSGTFTGSTTTSFATLTASGLTTGTALYVPVAAMTTGKALHVVANALTTGEVVSVSSSATAITGAGRLMNLDHTGTTSTSGVIAEVSSAATDETTIFRVTASAALAAGVALDVSAAALTTGVAIDVSNLAAITTGKGLHIDATGTTLTTGQLVYVDSGGTAITGAGRLFLSDHTGATTTSGVLNEFKSAATDESVILKVTASAALAAGVALDVSAASMTTGTAIDVSDLAAITTGKGIHIDASGTTLTTGILAHIDSAGTAITGAGRLLRVDHTGATTTSGVIAEFASAATDETVIAKVTASAALAAGVCLSVSAASMTTGTAVDLGDLDALTTGKGIDVVSNSADTSARDLIHVKNDNAAAVAAIPLHLENDGLVSTNFKIMMELDGVTVYISDGTTAEGNLTGVAGDICLNCAAGVAMYCDANGTNWTAM